MPNKNFLFNSEVMVLDPSADPRTDPNFPLTVEQFDVLTVDDLMTLLREEYHSDPNLAMHNPQILLNLCALLHAKGGVNCVKVQWDGYGVSSRHGIVPEASLDVLKSLNQRGQLTETVLESTVWSQLEVA